MEILAIHPGALGDILLSFPAMALLRRYSPGANITLACNSDYQDLLRRGCVDRVVPLAILPLHRLYSPDTLIRGDIEWWQSYDRIVSWTGSSDPTFIRNLRSIHSQALIADWHPSSKDSPHVSRLFADTLYPWIPRGSDLPQTRLDLDQETLGSGEEWLAVRGVQSDDLLVAMHPGAGSVAKRWRLTRFLEVCRILSRLNRIKILIIEGPAEQGLARAIAGGSGFGNCLGVESISLTILAALLLKCSGFLGNDSGIAHLAGALNIPSVVLFGPTLPEHWAPSGEHVAILRDSRGCESCITLTPTGHSCLDNLSSEEVSRRLLQHFPITSL